MSGASTELSAVQSTEGLIVKPGGTGEPCVGSENQGKGLESSGGKCDGIGFPSLFYILFSYIFYVKIISVCVLYWDGEGWGEFGIPPPPGWVDDGG